MKNISCNTLHAFVFATNMSRHEGHEYMYVDALNEMNAVNTLLEDLGSAPLEHGDIGLEGLEGRSDLVVKRFEAPLLAVFDTLDRRPVVTRTKDGSLILLTRLLGRRARVVTSDGVKWLTVEGLETTFGKARGEEHDWMLIERPTEISSAAVSSPWRAALSLLKGERGNILTIVVYAMGVGLLSLAVPLAVQSLVNTVAFGQLTQPLVVLTTMLTAGLLFAATLRALQTWVVEIVQRRVFVRLVSQIGDRLPRANITAFERGEGPELLNRFFDVFNAQKAIASILLGGVEASLTTLVGLLVLAFYHPLLLGFGLTLVASAIVVLSISGRGATRTTIQESKQKYAVAGWLEEMARHPFAVKSSGGEEFARARLDALASGWLRARDAHFRVYFRQYIGTLGLQVVAQAALLGLGGWLVMERSLTVGQLVAAELIVAAVVISLAKLGGKLETLYDLVASADKLSALLTLPVENHSGEEVLPKRGAVKIELKNAELGDDGRAYDLSLDAGEVVALRSATGRAAERGVLDVIFGLKSAGAGTVLVDGHDIRDVSLRSLRSRVSVVRGVEIFPVTIVENVRGSGNAAPSEVWRVLDQVGLADVIRGLPSGLQTKLSPSGFPLRATDAIRLTIARAILANPGLMVLDGSLDRLPEQERAPLVQTISNGRTVIVLTHEQNVADLCGGWRDLEPHVSRVQEMAQ